MVSGREQKRGATSPAETSSIEPVPKAEAAAPQLGMFPKVRVLSSTRTSTRYRIPSARKRSGPSGRATARLSPGKGGRIIWVPAPADAETGVATSFAMGGKPLPPVGRDPLPLALVTFEVGTSPRVRIHKMRQMERGGEMNALLLHPGGFEDRFLAFDGDRRP